MEQHLRLALWTLVFVGSLQAYPITPGGDAINPELPCFNFTHDLNISAHLKDVSCANGSTFLSPTNILESCYAAALATVEGELERALSLCDKNWEIGDTLDALEHSYKRPEQWPPANSTGCRWEDEPFEQFVEDMVSLVQQLHSRNCNVPADVSST